jgi:AcrR family transcriptional regulator
MHAATRRKKSDITRDAISDAARELFDRQGFERTTVRDIAARAGADPALVIRYFGSKDALFAQVAVFDLHLPDLSKVDRERIGETLVQHYLDVWEGENRTPGMAILLRSAASNEDAAAHMRKIFASQVLPAIARVAGPGSTPERASLVASQLLGMALCRYVLKIPPLVAMPQEKLVAEIGQTLQRYIVAWSQ